MKLGYCLSHSFVGVLMYFDFVCVCLCPYVSANVRERIYASQK